MELLVTLIRNLLCVFKSLLPGDYWVMKAAPLPFAAYGLDHFTSLEAAIGALQFTGAALNIAKGLQGVFGGFAVGAAIVNWRNALADYGESIGSDLNGKSADYNMLSSVLARQDGANNRRIAVGACQLVIGLGLAVLGLFSAKLVGFTVVVWALTLLEGALLVLLVIAGTGVANVRAVVRKVKALRKPDADDVDVVEFLAPLATTRLATGWEPDVSLRPSETRLRAHMENISKVTQQVCKTDVQEFHHVARVADKQAFLDSFLILLNVLAFLGYMTIPLTAFYPDEEPFLNYLPSWPGHGVVSWWGNLTGDVAWTIEPIAMILGPWLLLPGGKVRLSSKAKSE